MSIVLICLNGHCRRLSWRYLPNIGPMDVCKAYGSGNIPTRYGLVYPRITIDICLQPDLLIFMELYGIMES